MRNKILTALLSLFILSNVHSQIKDNTIRIVGQAQKTIEYKSLSISFKAKEIVPNEYRKIRYKSIDSILSEFKEKLRENGLSNLTFIKAPLKISRYSNSIEEYSIQLDNINQAELVNNSVVEGITLNDIKYFYDKLPDTLNEDLIKEAIKDAKRKANSVAKSINKKIGKIISITDKTGGIKKNSLNSSNPKSTLKYHTNVTFELLD